MADICYGCATIGQSPVLTLISQMNVPSCLKSDCKDARMDGLAALLY